MRRNPARAGVVAQGVLSDDHRAILDFETTHHHWKYAGAREAAILDVFGMTAVRYHQVLGALLDDPDSIAYAPSTVRRLQRLRDARERARSAKR